GDEPAPKIVAKPGGAAADPFGPEVPPEFVPRRPRTAEDRSRIEALHDYVDARALEKQRKLPEAIALLERALKKDPDSVALLRRLSLLYAARGRVEQAAEFSRKILAAEPGDTEAIQDLVEYHLRKKDYAGAEGLLKSILDNPKLARD